MLAVIVPADENILLKEFDKLSNYKDFEIEVTKMWKLKTKTIPLVIGALGMIQKKTQNALMKYLESLVYKEYRKLYLQALHIYSEKYSQCKTYNYLQQS